MKDSSLIYLVDDDLAFLQSLEILLTATGYQVEAFHSADEFLARHRAEQPGCVLLDFALHDRVGLDVQTALLQSDPSRVVIFLSGRATVPDCSEAMKAGAIDFLLKPINAPQLFEALKRALAKDHELRQQYQRCKELQQTLANLTERERTILDMVTQGLLNKEIADTIGITERTVKFHRGHLMKKLNAQSVIDLVHLVREAEAAALFGSR